MVGRQGDLQAAAQGSAVDRCHDRHADGLQRAHGGLAVIELLGELFGVRCGGLDHALDVAASKEGGLGRGQDDALDLSGLHSSLGLVHDFREVLEESLVHRVDRLVGVIHGQGEDAASVNLPLEHVLAHCFSCDVSCLSRKKRGVCA